MVLKKRILKKAVIATLTLSMAISNMGGALASNFADVNTHWAASQIDRLVEKGIISGYADGTFKPSKYITRAEFIALINKVYNYQDINDINYKDVSSKDWFSQEIKKAKAQGYISGYPDNTIRPNNEITRQEAATIIFKIISKQNNYINSNIDQFKDSNRVATWAKDSVGTLVDLAYMKGYPDGTFAPDQFINRAEAATIIDKIFKKRNSYTGSEIINTNKNGSTSNVSTSIVVKDANEFEKAINNKDIKDIELGNSISLSSTAKINRLVNIDLNGCNINGNIVVEDLNSKDKMIIRNGTLNGNLIINMPNADFENKAKIKGTTTIKDIKSSTFINNGTLGYVVIEDKNGVRFINNNTLDTLVIDTADEVKVEGRIPALEILKPAKLTIENKVTKMTIAENVDVSKLEIKADKNNIDIVVNNTSKYIKIGGNEYKPTVKSTNTGFSKLQIGYFKIDGTNPFETSKDRVINMFDDELKKGIWIELQDSRSKYEVTLNGYRIDNDQLKYVQINNNDVIVLQITSESGDKTLYKITTKFVPKSSLINLDTLKKSIENAKTLLTQQGKYTTESLNSANLDNVIKVAETIINDTNTTQQKVDEQINAISQAISKLVEKSINYKIEATEGKQSTQAIDPIAPNTVTLANYWIFKVDNSVGAKLNGYKFVIGKTDLTEPNYDVRIDNVNKTVTIDGSFSNSRVTKEQLQDWIKAKDSNLFSTLTVEDMSSSIPFPPSITDDSDISLKQSNAFAGGADKVDSSEGITETHILTINNINTEGPFKAKVTIGEVTKEISFVNGNGQGNYQYAIAKAIANDSDFNALSKYKMEQVLKTNSDGTEAGIIKFTAKENNQDIENINIKIEILN